MFSFSSSFQASLRRCLLSWRDKVSISPPNPIPRFFPLSRSSTPFLRHSPPLHFYCPSPIQLWIWRILLHCSTHSRYLFETIECECRVVFRGRLTSWALPQTDKVIRLLQRPHSVFSCCPVPFICQRLVIIWSTIIWSTWSTSMDKALIDVLNSCRAVYDHDHQHLPAAEREKGWSLYCDSVNAAMRKSPSTQQSVGPSAPKKRSASSAMVVGKEPASKRAGQVCIPVACVSLYFG